MVTDKTGLSVIRDFALALDHEDYVIARGFLFLIHFDRESVAQFGRDLTAWRRTSPETFFCNGRWAFIIVANCFLCTK